MRLLVATVTLKVRFDIMNRMMTRGRSNSMDNKVLI